jgi:RNA polymerase sigma factor (sigma-70 family)
MHPSVEQIADQVLVLDAQRGRREAFEALVWRWQKRLWWHAYDMTGHAEAAWDITQEGWVSIVRGLPGLKDPAKFGPWAYRIVSHKASDWISRQSKESSQMEPDDPGEVPAQPDRHEMVDDVHSVIRRLPALWRVVLSLRYLEGFGVAEIAQVLEAPEGTVKSRLHAARAEFRRLWEILAETSEVSIPSDQKGKTT